MQVSVCGDCSRVVRKQSETVPMACVALVQVYGYPVNGTLTLDENIADTEGVKYSYKAYKNYQKQRRNREERRLHKMEDIMEDQMFFLGWAFIWCRTYDDFLELFMDLLIDVHAPSPVRVNNVVSNIEGFAEAFRCPPDTPMNPKKRCSIW
ncbi:hypothetical protein RB195_017757 [Necator americanus]|uniref:Peptidase M13 C-terminal domain-containing protein n=1 Tax=Necator americanus TaxID=51031 RepID=A0ABR1CAA2_NECAM